MIITTTPTIEGYDIVKYLDIVESTAEQCYGDYSDKSCFFFEKLKADMEEIAKDIGANAIVGFKYIYSSIGEYRHSFITAYGTAVKIKKKE